MRGQESVGAGRRILRAFVSRAWGYVLRVRWLLFAPRIRRRARAEARAAIADGHLEGWLSSLVRHHGTPVPVELLEHIDEQMDKGKTHVPDPAVQAALAEIQERIIVVSDEEG